MDRIKNMTKIVLKKCAINDTNDTLARKVKKFCKNELHRHPDYKQILQNDTQLEELITQTVLLLSTD